MLFKNIRTLCLRPAPRRINEAACPVSVSESSVYISKNSLFPLRLSGAGGEIRGDENALFPLFLSPGRLRLFHDWVCPDAFFEFVLIPCLCAVNHGVSYVTKSSGGGPPAGGFSKGESLRRAARYSRVGPDGFEKPSSSFL